MFSALQDVFCTFKVIGFLFGFLGNVCNNTPRIAENVAEEEGSTQRH